MLVVIGPSTSHLNNNSNGEISTKPARRQDPTVYATVCYSNTRRWIDAGESILPDRLEEVLESLLTVIVVHADNRDPGEPLTAWFSTLVA